jgi:hypothetical protein
MQKKEQYLLYSKSEFTTQDYKRKRRHTGVEKRKKEKICNFKVTQDLYFHEI